MSSRKTKKVLSVVSNERIAEDVYDLRLAYPKEEKPDEVLAGQFVGVYSGDSGRILPRPISICGYDSEKGILRLVFRVVGAGTREFSSLKVGEAVSVLGILGNGYDVKALSGKRVLLIGGGIGAPPLLGLAASIFKENQKEEERQGANTGICAVLGYRTNDLFLKDEFEGICNKTGEHDGPAEGSRVIIATDDGSYGVHGNVIDAVRERLMQDGVLPFDVICSCGPLPMLRGIKVLAEETGIPAYVSLEERMACGVGACLGCVTPTVEVDSHSHVHNARICTEGPVFDIRKVRIG